ncbi:MAG: Hsp20/alpha crystallin family protein [Planctomycetota bacterium]|nr:Hsp20/alpha crystallin family protein [Planctomycetota bacterium]
MPSIPSPRDLPFSVQDMRNEFDRWLDRVWHGGLSSAPLDGQDWAPLFDVIDEKDCFRVRVEVPGLSADDIDVSILDDVLTIKGNKPSERKPGEDLSFLRAECRFGSFCRRFDLPTPVEEDSIRASCRNGVLTIEVPKTPEAMGRSVKIAFED